jgi:glucose-6-phosphate 1-dehydrogenase
MGGVPFFLRAGKRMRKRATEISIQFKQPPLLIFNQLAASGPCQEIQPNLLTIRIQPDEGIALRFGAKVPTSPNMDVCPVNMDFDYAAAFGKSSANGYERLLLDSMLGDQTLFSHRDGVETTWALYTPVLQAWAAKESFRIILPELGSGVFPNYFAGTWGPECSRSAAGEERACLEERFGEEGGLSAAGRREKGTGRRWWRRSRSKALLFYFGMTFTKMPSGSSPSRRWTTPSLT